MSLIIVSNRSNRLPVSISKENGKIRLERSVGGLATGLESYVKQFQNQGFTWVGWPGATLCSYEEKLLGERVRVEHNSHLVSLSDKQVEEYYSGFCNSTLYPIFHSFEQYASLDSATWETYEKINHLFCNAVCEVANEGDTIWINDYHLLLLPELLKKRLPNCSICFFLHIPFPPTHSFEVIPVAWRKKLVRGMLGADVVGFHIREYCENFKDAAVRDVGAGVVANIVLTEARKVKTDCFPMSVNFHSIYSYANSEDVQKWRAIFRRKTNNNKLMLSIDRLDYTKGITNKLLAFRKFLVDNPVLRGICTMVVVVVPSRTELEINQKIKAQLEKLVHQINDEFRQVDWQPIVYLFKKLSYQQVIRLYSSCDVLLVTPLKDGMNLVCKEYIASRTQTDGVIILSQTAGACQELNEALIVDAHNVSAISTAMLKACTMTKFEQSKRMEALQQTIQSYDLNMWADDLLSNRPLHFQRVRVQPIQANA
jgi:trehalose 6-phosphate synthase/phosphatase